MHKYFLFIKIGMQEMMMYRFNFFSWFFVEGIGALIMAYIWLSIYKEGNVVGGYSLRDMIVYYVVSRIIGMIVIADDIAYKVSDDIHNGKLINNILKPINYLRSVFATNLGATITALLLSLPVVVLILTLFPNYINPSLFSILLFILSLLLATAISFLTTTIVGMVAFFMDNIVGVIFLNWMLLSLFSGRMLPNDIMPSYVQTISNYLPYKYMTFSSLQIITSKISIRDSIIDVLISFFWVLVLAVINKYIFKIGIKRYESYGI
jgi:ABC-2 type transport system permease protein